MADEKPQQRELFSFQDGRNNEGIKLLEYGKKIQMVRFQTGSNGKDYIRFCYPKLRDGASDKFRPMGIDWEDRNTAIRCLEQALHVLKNDKGAPILRDFKSHQKQQPPQERGGERPF